MGMTIGGTNQVLFTLISNQIAEFATRVWAVNTTRVRFISVMTVPRPDALQNLGGKIFKLERLREVKLSVSFKPGHMRPTAGHQKAGDVSPFRLVDSGKRCVIGQYDIRYEQINFSFLKYLCCVSYTGGGRDVVSIVRQQSRQQVYDAAVVFEQQYVLHLS
jgi:hypothetical protein